MTIVEQLAVGPLVLDGGLSTALEARGHDLSGLLWSARLLREAPDEIVAAHRGFVDAGAQVVITASYQASHAGYRAAGLTDVQCDADLDASVHLAREAAGDRALVAASVGPWGAHLADGSEYTGYPDVSRARLRDFHGRRLERLVAAEPDVVAVETIPEVLEAEVVVELLEELAPELPYWVSFSATEGARVTGGAPFAEAATVVGPSAVAVGVNCTAPQHVDALLESASASVPFVVYPNAGATYDARIKAWTADGTSTFPAATVQGWRDSGASLVGGCCGIDADGVRSIADAVSA
ncbi:homocysteine methyltransferase [Knoellia flava TL1]|uniref:Homocysteine S-methyltransferase n=2 Tax=Knoellia flava TaxID=913969 RepID=A0A8H9FRQ6_9MICO|nr:homocysteine S-methyltransferase [Knoellia flava]KGN31408.1 homocysteine methyltransferase [Knoellia flava TL1]GGB72121.1 homocysteine S-methyltransferase [Knoellia flava]